MNTLSITSATSECMQTDVQTLSHEEAAAMADLFKALSDPARVQIMHVLATNDEPVCVCHLTAPLGLSQPTVSHHMRRLMEAGLVEREQHGRWAYFSLRNDAVQKLRNVAQLKGACC